MVGLELWWFIWFYTKKTLKHVILEQFVNNRVLNVSKQFSLKERVKFGFSRPVFLIKTLFVNQERSKSNFTQIRIIPTSRFFHQKHRKTACFWAILTIPWLQTLEKQDFGKENVAKFDILA